MGRYRLRPAWRDNIRGGEGKSFRFHDEFHDVKSAGTVNGTLATDGHSLRVVGDIGNNISVGAGVLDFAGGTGTWGQTVIAWDTAIPRPSAAGTGYHIEIDIVADNDAAMWVGLATDTSPGDPGAADCEHAFLFNSDGRVDIVAGGATVRADIFPYTNGASYRVRFVLKQGGCQYLISDDGGATYVGLYDAVDEATATLYAAISNYNAVFTADNVRQESRTYAATDYTDYISVLRLVGTMAGAGNLTLERCTPTGGTATVSWGDGTDDTVIAADDTANVVHAYAGAGIYNITISNAERITQIRLQDAQIGGFDSSELSANVITYFWMTAITGSTVRSADMTGWTPTHWYLRSMPAGTYAIDSADMAGWTPADWYLRDMPAGTYAIDSADMALWTPTHWYLRNMPAGTYAIDSADMALWTPTHWRLYNMPAGTYAIDSADMALWTPTYWWLFSMPAGTYAIDSADMALWTPTDWQLYSIHAASLTLTVVPANLAGWTTCTTMRAQDNSLLQAQVDAILYGMYLASVAPRTATGGTIHVGGTNAAPSGVFQAAASCPVDAATPGKEVAHELLNDTCDAFANHWATVTITA